MPQPKVKIHGIAHITGGGIPSKFFGDFLKPRGLSARLTDLWEPPKIMQNLAKWRGVSGKEAYEIWHGGQGALLIGDKADVGRVLDLASLWGVSARKAGVITQSKKPTLIIRSKFADDSTLVWE